MTKTIILATIITGIAVMLSLYGLPINAQVNTGSTLPNPDSEPINSPACEELKDSIANNPALQAIVAKVCR